MGTRGALTDRSMTVSERAAGSALSTIVLAVVATLALDFGLHGGLIAPLYDWNSPFLVSQADAFARIPIGYLGLILEVFVVWWLLGRLGVPGAIAGSMTAAGIGAGVSGAFLLGLASISTADLGLLLAWFAGSVVEFAVAGAVVGARMAGRSSRSVGTWVAALLVVAVILAVAVQSQHSAAMIPILA